MMAWKYFTAYCPQLGNTNGHPGTRVNLSHCLECEYGIDFQKVHGRIDCQFLARKDIPELEFENEADRAKDDCYLYKCRFCRRVYKVYDYEPCDYLLEFLHRVQKGAPLIHQCDEDHQGVADLIALQTNPNKRPSSNDSPTKEKENSPP